MVGHIPFVERDDQRPSLFDHPGCDLEVLHFEPAGRVEQKNDHFGVINGPASIGDRQALQLVLDLGPFPEARRIDQADLAPLPIPINADRIPSDPGLGAGNHPIFADHLVDQGRFTGVRPANDCQLKRAFALELLFVGILMFVFDMRANGLEQVRHAFAMLGANGDRIAKAETIGVENSRSPEFPSALLATMMTGVAPARSQRPISSSSGSHPFARIDEEQRCVGLADRCFGLCPHPSRQRLRVLVLEPCGVDHPKLEPKQLRLALAPVAGHSRRSSTSARRLPTSRLNSVDLPTLGRPTMATVG